MNELITAGGVFMYPLLICSILIISIAIERFWFLQERLVSPQGLRAQITNLLDRSKLNDSQKQNISDISALGLLLMTAYKYKDLTREALESKLNERSSEVKFTLERNLTMLGTIATISPLLGLLGTVVGMIVAFTGLTASGGADSDVLALGISQALITTAFGLFIAVPGLVLHKYFEQRINHLLLILQAETSEFIDLINK
ncbi:MotA/TolQ/ExbB proton channel family protein [Gammaproteobacteria bacterium]|jgi:biopolymer transport protein ExbB|nr:MotA/TolQ/ExbB proton channel family protein [Gammaproteobacteria bacterium]MDB4059695.1 MotA/TolQ/ExbB proton channel family protein [Gammaproteobacteria bacterium]MDB9997403.1 MotA/TolQ/ExbB proton channel family protein [Gammaproteobacteria bacterium]|tara:strand:- start:682 stop:1281 length:600 start_codon:yes stop_codon:yes gene_type:complete